MKRRGNRVQHVLYQNHYDSNVFDIDHFNNWLKRNKDILPNEI
jgi:hypothetical protein